MKSRYILGVLAVLLIASCSIVFLDAQDTQADPGSEFGTNGKGVIIWTYDADTKTLTVEGPGKENGSGEFRMPNYVIENSGWEKFAPYAQNLVINGTFMDISPSAFKNFTALITLDFSGSLVTEVAANAFEGCTALTSVITSSILENLGSYSFAGCTALTSFTTSSLKNIGTSVFEGCTSLESIELPTNISSIYESAFIGCTSLIEITIPEENTKYCSFAGGLYFMDDATSFRLVTVLPGWVGTYELPAEVWTLGMDCQEFYSCAHLTEITVEDSNTYYHAIDGILFDSQTGMLIAAPPAKDFGSDMYVIPEGVESIRANAFKNCVGLEALSISSDVKRIENEAFVGCSNLGSIKVYTTGMWTGSRVFDMGTVEDPLHCDVLINKDQTIGAFTDDEYDNTTFTVVSASLFKTTLAVMDYTEETSFTITYFSFFGDVIQFPEAPEGYVYLNPFDLTYVVQAYNDNLSVAIVESNTQITGTCGEDLEWVYYAATNTLTISGEGAMEEFESGTPWASFDVRNLVIEEGVTLISEQAFFIPGLESAMLPSSLEEIGVGAFAYTSLTELMIPSTVRYIGEGAFIGCFNLTINVASNNTSYKTVDGSLFTKDGKIILFHPFLENETHYDVPNTVTRIGFGVFAFNEYLSSVSLPEGLEEIGMGAFNECVSLHSMTIPYTVTEIGDYAFYYCITLQWVDIPTSITHLGEGAFAYCYALEKITISSKTTYIGLDAFRMQNAIMTCEVVSDVEGIIDGYTDMQLTYIQAYTVYVTYNTGTDTVHLSFLSVPGTVHATDQIEGVTFTIGGVPHTGDSFMMPNADIYIIVTHTTVQMHTVTVMIGSTELPSQVLHGETFELPASLQIPGHTFIGWYIGENKIEGSTITVTGDVTITAKFERISVIQYYTVTFLNADGSVFSESSLAAGTVITVPGIPVKAQTIGETFAFSAWTGYTAGMVVSDNISFEPIFVGTPRTYTVEFESEGFVWPPIQVAYGAEIRIPIPDPEKDPTVEYKYVFKGWLGFPEDKLLVESLIGDNGKIRFVAEYEATPRFYDVIFVGYATPIKIPMAYGTLIELPDNNPTKDSTATMEYIFDSWEGYVQGMKVSGDITFRSLFMAVPVISNIDDTIVDGTAVINAGDSEKLELSSDVIEAIMSVAPANGAEVATENGSFEIDLALLEYLRGQLREGQSIIMTMSKVDLSSNPEMAAVIGDRPVFDISLGSITSFDGGKLKIGLKYTLQEGEDAEHIKVWCVGIDGSIEAFDCVYSNGSVYFETEHLSYYAIVYDPSGTPAPEDRTLFYVVGLLSITMAALIAAVYFARQ